MRHAVLCLIVSTLLAGCAAHHRRPMPPASPSPVAAEVPPGSPTPGLSAYIEQLRLLSGKARPKSSPSEVAEKWSQELSDALDRAGKAPSADTLLRAGHAYRAAGITDQAFEYYARAARLEPRNAAPWDAMARIWRDWGAPHLALGDAYRALNAGPDDPAVRNTLGTIFQALGQPQAAREQFRRALQLEPGATYALNNLCYSWTLEGDVPAASAACRQALALSPGFAVAENNLGLALAVTGDLAGAEASFTHAAGSAAAQFNLGIVHLANRQFGRAAAAFDRAWRLQPTLERARLRAVSARTQATAAGDVGDHDDRR